VLFGKAALGQLLKNVTYAGKGRHHDEIFDGEHDAVIDPDTVDLVQQTLAKNCYEKTISKSAVSPRRLAR
jgi:hypothetical protein